MVEIGSPRTDRHRRCSPGLVMAERAAVTTGGRPPLSLAVTGRISPRRHANLAHGVEPGPRRPVERSGIEQEIRMRGRNDVGPNLQTPTPREPVRHPPNNEDARRGLRGDRL